MHLADLLKALVLGIVEGLTEFIPVSSTAHLLLTSYLLDFQSIKNNVFEIAIQVGAVFAILIIYRQKIFSVIFNINQKNNQKFVANIFFAFIPAVIFGMLFYEIIKQVFFSNLVIAISLILGGIVLILVDRKPRKSTIESVEEITLKKSIFVGCFQIIAMIPGVSRSGATIIGSLLFGFNRKTAAEFSFFLAIPTIAAATVYDIYKNYSSLNLNDGLLLLLGTLSAFISSMLVVKWLLSYITKHNFVIFGIYRIIIGIAILIFII